MAVPKKPTPTQKPTSKGISASASNVLRGAGGAGPITGSMSMGQSAGPAGKPGQNTHSPFNSNAMKADRAKGQQQKAGAIQGRKAPGA